MLALRLYGDERQRLGSFVYKCDLHIPSYLRSMLDYKRKRFGPQLHYRSDLYHPGQMLTFGLHRDERQRVGPQLHGWGDLHDAAKMLALLSYERQPLGAQFHDSRYMHVPSQMLAFRLYGDERQCAGASVGSVWCSL